MVFGGLGQSDNNNKTYLLGSSEKFLLMEGVSFSEMGFPYLPVPHAA